MNSSTHCALTMGRNSDMIMPAASKPRDANYQRYMYVLACLVGQTVTVQLRNNVTFSGIFHSYNVPGPAGSSENVLILKYARELPSEDRLSGPIENVVVIDSDDIVSISTSRCPLTFNEAKPRSGLKTDAEISQNAKTGNDRELERWEPPEGDTPSTVVENSLVDEDKRQPSSSWNQFEVNARQFQVKSTYQEEIYTTPLDVGSIPQFVKEKADQIAREIEAENIHGADEGENGEDEEACFGAVRGTGAYRNEYIGVKPLESNATDISVVAHSNAAAHPSTLNTETKADKTTEENAKTSNVSSSTIPAPFLLPTKAGDVALSSKASLFLARSGLKLHPRIVGSGRGSRQPGHTLPSRCANQALVKNINALNLEPALPKFADLFSRGRTHGKNNLNARGSSDTRNTSGHPADRAHEKNLFVESLEMIRNRMSRIDWDSAVPPRTSVAAAAAAVQFAKKSVGTHQSGAASRICTEHALRHSHALMRREVAAYVAGSSSRKLASNGTAISRKGCPNCITEGIAALPGPCPHDASGSAERRLLQTSTSQAVTNDDSGTSVAPQALAPKFEFFQTNPKYYRHIDTILTSVVLDNILNEDPSSVSPSWNAGVDPSVSRLAHYSDILGSIRKSTSSTGKDVSKSEEAKSWAGAASGSTQHSDKPTTHESPVDTTGTENDRAFRNATQGGSKCQPLSSHETPKAQLGSQTADSRQTTNSTPGAASLPPLASTPSTAAVVPSHASANAIVDGSSQQLCKTEQQTAVGMQRSYSGSVTPASPAACPQVTVGQPQLPPPPVQVHAGGYPAFPHYNGNYFVLPPNALFSQPMVGTYMTEEGIPANSGNVPHYGAPPHQLVTPNSGSVELHPVIPIDASSLIMQQQQALNVHQQQQQPHTMTQHGGQPHNAGGGPLGVPHQAAHKVHGSSSSSGYIQGNAYPASQLMGFPPGSSNVMYFPSGAFLATQPTGQTASQFSSQNSSAHYAQGNAVVPPIPGGSNETMRTLTSVAGPAVQWIVNTAPSAAPQLSQQTPSSRSGTSVASGSLETLTAGNSQGGAGGAQNCTNNGNEVQNAPLAAANCYAYSTHPMLKSVHGSSSTPYSRHPLHVAAPTASMSHPANMPSSTQESHHPPPPPPPSQIQQQSQHVLHSGTYSRPTVAAPFRKQGGQQHPPPPPPSAADKNAASHDCCYPSVHGPPSVLGGVASVSSNSPSSLENCVVVAGAHCDTAPTPPASLSQTHVLHSNDSPSTTTRGGKAMRTKAQQDTAKVTSSTEKALS